MDDRVLAKAEAALGGVLFITPLWVTVVQDVSMIAGMIAAVAGAIIGVHAVYRLWRRER